MIRTRLRVACLLAALMPTLQSGVSAAAGIHVVTTTEDLAALVREVGGDRVEVQALARGYQNPHFVEPKPSFILKLHKADLLVVVGRELEVGWLTPLILQSRNGAIQRGGDRYLDASLTAEILDVPTGPITRAMGDVHPLGNPHFLLDPANGRRVAEAIRAMLEAMSPADTDYFATRYADFDRRLAQAEIRWDARMAPWKGARIVTYHRSWPNLCKRFGLEVVGYVEPRPAIPPSPRHTLELMAEMKRQAVRIIVVEPYFDLKTPRKIAAQTSSEVLVLLPSVGGEKHVKTYLDLFDHDIETLATALQDAAGR